MFWNFKVLKNIMRYNLVNNYMTSWYLYHVENQEVRPEPRWHSMFLKDCPGFIDHSTNNIDH